MADLNRLREMIRLAAYEAVQTGYRISPDVWGIERTTGGRIVVTREAITTGRLHPLACVGAFLPFTGAIPRPEGDESSTIFYIGQSLNVGESWCAGFVNGLNGTPWLETGTEAYRLGREMRAELCQ